MYDTIALRQWVECLLGWYPEATDWRDEPEAQSWIAQQIVDQAVRSSDKARELEDLVILDDFVKRCLTLIVVNTRRANEIAIYTWPHANTWRDQPDDRDLDLTEVRKIKATWRYIAGELGVSTQTVINRYSKYEGKLLWEEDGYRWHVPELPSVTPEYAIEREFLDAWNSWASYLPKLGIRTAAYAVDHVAEALYYAVLHLRNKDETWDSIGKRLGISRQLAQYRYTR
ncbi:hypothetical protein [Kineococcus sp. R86509]|uniref:hypothetical protein n=1 Tax=Kineococcus sp. R86509 TaxID=3093851 RepID=UPI0036D2DC27